MALSLERSRWGLRRWQLAGPAMGLGIRLLAAIVLTDASTIIAVAGEVPRSDPRISLALNEESLARIGQQLFNSPLLSADATVSCSTCHISKFGFSGDRPQPVGVAGYVDRRRAPSLLGLRKAQALMWDGRATSLATQVVLPLEGREMAISWPVALSRLAAQSDIGRLSGGTAVKELDRETVILALAAYVASLDSGQSRFDRFFYGGDRNALTSQESWGLRLFVRKAGCSSCHLLDGTAAPFTDGSFHDTGFGKVDEALDRGRGEVTGEAADVYAFKTPSLRDVARRPYLMHDGSMSSLRAVVARYNSLDRASSPNLDKRLGPRFLTSDELDAIVAFLGALTPENVEKDHVVAR